MRRLHFHWCGSANRSSLRSRGRLEATCDADGQVEALHVVCPAAGCASERRNRRQTRTPRTLKVSRRPSTMQRHFRRSNGSPGPGAMWREQQWRYTPAWREEHHVARRQVRYQRRRSSLEAREPLRVGRNEVHLASPTQRMRVRVWVLSSASAPPRSLIIPQSHVRIESITTEPKP
jgi:hypothetical protein